MMYLVVIFVSPLYFILQRKWLAAAVNSFFYLVAWVFVLSMIGAFLAPIPWFIAAVHAVMAYRKQLVAEDATVMAQKMVEAMRHEQQAGR